ncbi:MAG: glycosyltransferase involved in cell wall biosynthesis, partial [Candidatus Paceibacteria bacterium]
VTQVVDTEHPILGFFHRWVEEFAKHCEHVHVICLQEGKHSLPANVTVHSLGKDEGKGKFTYLIRFYSLIWKLRHEYDNVFVHMNQVYVILGDSIWHLFRKRVGLWYMHGTVPASLRVAEKFVHKIFTGSPESFRLKSNKVLVTGHGIDTVQFAPQTGPKDIDLITVGRITPSKNLIVLVDILKKVRDTHDVSLTIVGAGVTEEEKQYEQKLRDYVQELGLVGAVHFVGRIPQTELPQYLNRAKIFVTVAQNGSLDKAILEPMACGLPVVSMAPGSASLPIDVAQVSDQETFIQQVNDVLESNVFKNEQYTEYVIQNHSIKSLIPKILQTYV